MKLGGAFSSLPVQPGLGLPPVQTPHSSLVIWIRSPIIGLLGWMIVDTILPIGDINDCVVCGGAVRGRPLRAGVLPTSIPPCAGSIGLGGASGGVSPSTMVLADLFLQFRSSVGDVR